MFFTIKHTLVLSLLEGETQRYLWRNETTKMPLDISNVVPSNHGDNKVLRLRLLVDGMDEENNFQRFHSFTSTEKVNGLAICL